MKLNDENLKMYLKKHLDHNEILVCSLYGIIEPQVEVIFNLGTLAIANNFFYLGFTNRNILILHINLKNIPVEKTVVEYDTIKIIKYKNWGFWGKKIIIKYFTGEEVILKFSKYNFSIKEQKKNLFIFENTILQKYI
jgi:hypothetical protein